MALILIHLEKVDFNADYIAQILHQIEKFTSYDARATDEPQGIPIRGHVTVENVMNYDDRPKPLIVENK